MIKYIPYILYPRVGWFILHAAAVGFAFFIGYTVKF